MHLNFHKYKNLNKMPVYLLSKTYYTYLNKYIYTI